MYFALPGRANTLSLAPMPLYEPAAHMNVIVMSGSWDVELIQSLGSLEQMPYTCYQHDGIFDSPASSRGSCVHAEDHREESK
jgi:hypothetical protein